MSDRGPRGGGPGPDAVLRAVLVVALVATASLALQARRGLDWDALSDPVQIRWARVLAGAVILLVLAATGRRLLRRLRRPRRPTRTGGGGRAEPEGEPFPWLLRILAALLVAGVLAAAWFVADALTGSGPDGAPPAADPRVPGDPSARPQLTWWTVAEVAAALLVVAAVARLVQVRVARAPDDHDDGPDRREEGEPVAATLRAAVDAAEGGLLAPGDARAAIVAAYAAMAQSISAGLARRGGPVPPSDTPTELLERAVAARLVAAGPAGRLTGLFREARFSRHPMGEAERRAAEQALAGVRDELVARRG